MACSAAGTAAAFTPSTTSAQTTYSSAMKGTSRAVTAAMLRMPPRITAPTTSAKARPSTQALPAKGLALPPVVSMMMAAA